MIYHVFTAGQKLSQGTPATLTQQKTCYVVQDWHRQNVRTITIRTHYTVTDSFLPNDKGAQPLMTRPRGIRNAINPGIYAIGVGIKRQYSDQMVQLFFFFLSKRKFR